VIFKEAGNETDHQKEGGLISSAGEGNAPPDAKTGELGALGISYSAKEKADQELAKNKTNAINTGDQSKESIYFFGPQAKIFKFVLKTRSWEALKSDKASLFKAGMKHMSLVALEDQQKMVMTGGVSIATCAPLSTVYEFRAKAPTAGRGLRSMTMKRYGHASTYCRERLIVFGGFAHRDVAEEPP
jgi:hypothetical protein